MVVQRCSSSAGGVSGALTRVRAWLAECGFSTTSVTLNGETLSLWCARQRHEPQQRHVCREGDRLG